MPKITDDEYHLLGLALVMAQRVEFALYGLAAHAAHISAARKEKRFRDLTPERFLRGDLNDLKATLGQLIEAFGEVFLIRTTDLVEFYEDRNLIAHDYTRIFQMDIRGVKRRDDAHAFLRGFLERAVYWESVLRGLLNELKLAAAKKEGREAEIVFSTADLERIRAFHKHVAKYLSSRSASTKGELPKQITRL